MRNIIVFSLLLPQMFFATQKSESIKQDNPLAGLSIQEAIFTHFNETHASNRFEMNTPAPNGGTEAAKVSATPTVKVAQSATPVTLQPNRLTKTNTDFKESIFKGAEAALLAFVGLGLFLLFKNIQSLK